MMRIVVPIVASYPDRRGVFRNACFCRRLGHDVRIDPAFQQRGRFSNRESHGTPESRARNLQRLIFDNRPSASLPLLVASATGGYGSVRMLHRVPKGAFSDTVSVGFSDSTAVAIWAALESRYPAFHGPCFEDREFMDALPYYTLRKCSWEARLTFADRMPRRVSGIVWGGNLTTFGYMAHEVATHPKFLRDKAIFFFEDVYDEETYSKVDVGALVEMEFDRLEYVGILDRAVAILLGRFPRMQRPSLLKILRKFYKGPVAGLDIGHAYGKKSWALMPPIPLGARTTLSRGGNTLVCGWEAGV